MATYTRFCEGAVISVSPSGELALTETLRLVTISSGEVTALPVPDIDRPLRTYYIGPQAVTFWEDDGNVLIEIPEPRANGRGDGFSYVRCQLSTSTCERASDPVVGEPTPLSPLN